MDKFQTLLDKLEKGGKPAAVGEVRDFGGVQYQKMGNGDWKPYVHEEEKQLQAEQNKNKVVSLTDKLKAKVEEKKTVSASAQHLSDLQNQTVVPGEQTRSEKPMFTNVDAALAHGYDAKDFREVGNFFYDRAQKMAENIAKLEATKQKVDPNFEKIKAVNLRMAKQFISQGNRIDDRKAKTKMSKSVVMMGHADAAEVDTSKFATENMASREQGWWLETFQNVMNGYEYGDVPRVITLDKGDLYLAKVDDGLYSGIFKKITFTDDGVLEDNAKVRLERMSIPSLIQFCLAKEWMGVIDKKEVESEQATAGLIAKLEAPVVVPEIIPDPVPVNTLPPIESDLDKRIRILELIQKLTT